MNDKEATSFGNCPSMCDLMRVLSGARRYEIIVLLAAAPKEVSSIAHELEAEISAVSHELRTLREYDCVQLARTGTRHTYRLSDRLQVVHVSSDIWLEGRSDDGERLLLQIGAAADRNATVKSNTQVGG